MTQLIARDQYNEITWLKTKHPRKELLELNYATHAEKMYRDNIGHVGYVIRGYWYEIFTVDQWKVTR